MDSTQVYTVACIPDSARCQTSRLLRARTYNNLLELRIRR